MWANTRSILKKWLSFFCFSLLYANSMAQTQVEDSAIITSKEDSAILPAKKNSNIFRRALGAVSRSPGLMLDMDTIQVKSETPFLGYDGKVIRNIQIEKFGFEKTFQDTSKGISYFGTKILNALHNNTKKSIVKQNLFFKENTKVDAYQLADNERYLRSLRFIQDARILVVPVFGCVDSVDILVVTKDLFSINGSLGQLDANRFRGKASDVNLMGLGQTLQVSVLVDKDRNPGFGYDVQYTKNNIGGSFIHGTIGYTTMNNNIGNGDRNEHGWYARLERPLASAFSHVAGALTVARYQTDNNFNKFDSNYFQYKYSTYDAWIGYNIGANKLLRNSGDLGRCFVSMRYFDNHFREMPFQAEQPYDLRFNTRKALLGQVTFFKQKFYKTNYIYAFGTTEDIPYGYNVSAIAGWYKQLGLSRFYSGTDVNRYVVTRRGGIIQYYLRSGGFLRNGNLEDGVLLLGTSFFSRLLVYPNMKVRQYINISFTRQFNRMGLYPLELNNDFGVSDFRYSRDLVGEQRASLHSETSFFLKPKLFGFKFSPFLFGDGSLLSPEKEKFHKSSFYYGVGGGVRTRNENLVFGTIELRVTCFPRQTENMNFFKIGLTSNLRFRYNSTYVKAPDLVPVNSDADNSIY